MKSNRIFDCYNRNTVLLYQNMVSVEFTSTQHCFLSYFPAVDCIPDFGCGFNCDAEAFSEQWYQVEMVNGFKYWKKIYGGT